MYSWGNGDVVFNIGKSDGELGFNLNGSGDPGWGGSAAENEFHTFAWTLSGSSGNVSYYIDGSGVDGDGGIGSYPTNPSNAEHNIGGGSSFRSDGSFDGRIAEVVVTNTNESSQAIQEYHNSRLN